jgi:DNA invertase Pin-like site-specific DNA recombinase
MGCEKLIYLIFVPKNRAALELPSHFADLQLEDFLMLIGYARVSTHEQNLDLQNDALKAAGCEHIFTDTASGAKTDRPGLSAALELCRKEDTLVVWKLDRLGRSLPHLVETVRDLVDKGVGFKSLQESIDTTTSGGKLIFHIFASLAEFERDIIKGVNTKKQKAALALKANPQYSIREICEIVGISRNTYYKYTRQS